MAAKSRAQDAAQVGSGEPEAQAADHRDAQTGQAGHLGRYRLRPGVFTSRRTVPVRRARQWPVPEIPFPGQARERYC